MREEAFEEDPWTPVPISALRPARAKLVCAYVIA